MAYPGSHGPLSQGPSTTYQIEDTRIKRQIPERTPVNLDSANFPIMTFLYGDKLKLGKLQGNYMKQWDAKVKRLPVNFRQYFFYNDEDQADWFNTSGALTEADDTMAVEAGQGTRIYASVADGNSLYATVQLTGEVIQILAADGSDSGITIARGAQGTAAAEIPDGTQIVILGSTAGEISKAPISYMNETWRTENATQFMRETLETSKRRQDLIDSGDIETADEKKREGELRARRLCIRFERSILFNKGHVVAPTAGEGGATCGLDGWIQTNRLDKAGNSLTQSELDDMVLKCTRETSATPIIVASEILMKTINEYGSDAVRSLQKDKDTTYGRKTEMYRLWCANADMKLFQHPLLSSKNWEVNPYVAPAAPGEQPVSAIGNAGKSFIVTPELMSMAVLKDIGWHEIIRADGMTTVADDIQIEAGFHITNELPFAVIENMAAIE